MLKAPKRFRFAGWFSKSLCATALAAAAVTACSESPPSQNVTKAAATSAPEPAFTPEDFAFMLQAKKGAYLWLGQGRDNEHLPLHHPRYDFNDDIIPLGIKWHTHVAERVLAR